MSFASQSHYAGTPSFGWGYQSLEGFDDAFGSQTRRSMRQGSSGNDVRIWQEALNRWLAATGGAAIQVDSSFGPSTTDATKAFQGSQNVAQDGVVGPNTQSKMALWNTGRAMGGRNLVRPGVRKGTPPGPPGTSQPQAPANSIPLSQANAAIQSVARNIPGAAFVRRDLNMPPSPGSLQVQGVFYLFLDTQGRTVTSQLDVRGGHLPLVSSGVVPGMFQPPGQPHLDQPPAVAPPPPAATGTDMKPLYLAAGIGATVLAIIAVTTIASR